MQDLYMQLLFITAFYCTNAIPIVVSENYNENILIKTSSAAVKCYLLMMQLRVCTMETKASRIHLMQLIHLVRSILV